MILKKPYKLQFLRRSYEYQCTWWITRNLLVTTGKKCPALGNHLRRIGQRWPHSGNGAEEPGKMSPPKKAPKEGLNAASFWASKQTTKGQQVKTDHLNNPDENQSKIPEFWLLLVSSVEITGKNHYYPRFLHLTLTNRIQYTLEETKQFYGLEKQRVVNCKMSCYLKCIHSGWKTTKSLIFQDNSDSNEPSF